MGVYWLSTINTTSLRSCPSKWQKSVLSLRSFKTIPMIANWNIAGWQKPTFEKVSNLRVIHVWPSCETLQHRAQGNINLLMGKYVRASNNIYRHPQNGAAQQNACFHWNKSVVEIQPHQSFSWNHAISHTSSTNQLTRLWPSHNDLYTPHVATCCPGEEVELSHPEDQRSWTDSKASSVESINHCLIREVNEACLSQHST